MAAGHDQSQAHLGAHPCAGSRQKLIWATLLILVGGTMFQLRATFSSPRASASVRERTDNSPSTSLLRPQQLVDSPPPQLPLGWASATDPSSKRRYYYHAARKTVQWSPPNAAATPTDGPPGPPTTARPPTVTNTNTNTNMPAAIDVAPPRSPVTPTDFVQKLPGYPHSSTLKSPPLPLTVFKSVEGITRLGVGGTYEQAFPLHFLPWSHVVESVPAPADSGGRPPFISPQELGLSADRESVIDDYRVADIAERTAVSTTPTCTMPSTPRTVPRIKIITYPPRDLNILSVTRIEHRADYKVPRMPDRVLERHKHNPRGICQHHWHQRLTFCRESYWRDPRVLGMNQPCAFYNYVATKDCVYVDLGMGFSGFTGGLANATHWFKTKNVNTRGLPQTVIPQSPRIFKEPIIVAALGASAEANSHFPIEILPLLCYLLEVVPNANNMPLLYEASGTTTSILKYMGKKGLLNFDKVIAIPGASPLKTNNANAAWAPRVYFAEQFPGQCVGADSQQEAPTELSNRVKRLLKPEEVPMDDRNLVIFLHRDDQRAIPPKIEKEVVAVLQRTVVGTPCEVKVYKFSKQEFPTFDTILDLFNRAAVIIGVHGAGLANLMWAPRCTSVIEIMYENNFLATPTAFYAHAIARGHDYWMQMSPGHIYASALPDPKALGEIVAQVIVEKEAAKKSAEAPGSDPLLTYCDGIGARNRTYIDAIRNSFSASQSAKSRQAMWTIDGPPGSARACTCSEASRVGFKDYTYCDVDNSRSIATSCASGCHLIRNAGAHNHGLCVSSPASLQPSNKFLQYGQ